MPESFETRHVLLLYRSINGFGSLRVWRIPAPELANLFRYIVVSEALFFLPSNINPGPKKVCSLASDELEAFNQAVAQLDVFDDFHQAHIKSIL